MDRGKAEIEQLLIHSGLFFVEDNKPVGVLSLNRRKNYQPFTTKSKLLPGISDLATRVMVRKLRDVIYRYEHDQPDYSAFHRELLEDIEKRLLNFIDNHQLKKEDLEPQYSQFKKKLIKLYKIQIKKDWGPLRVPSKASQKFYNLILPIIRRFKKYLTNLETKKCEASLNTVFHYTSLVLVACEIEKSDTDSGHHPVYNKIKQFYDRHKSDIKSAEQWHSQYRI